MNQNIEISRDYSTDTTVTVTLRMAVNLAPTKSQVFTCSNSAVQGTTNIYFDLIEI